MGYYTTFCCTSTGCCPRPGRGNTVYRRTQTRRNSSLGRDCRVATAGKILLTVMLTAALAAGALHLPPLNLVPLNLSPPVAHAATDRVQLAFAGDVLLGSRVGKLMDERGPDWPWAQVAPVLKAADLAVCNLECAVGTSGQPQAGKQWTFRAKPAALGGLVRAGIDVVGLANNHVLDYGTSCLLETLDNLDRSGATHLGAGRNQQEASSPRIIEINGLKIGLLASSLLVPTLPGGKGTWAATDNKPGIFSGHDHQRLLQSVHALSSRADWTVLFLHWGEERAEYPQKWQQNLASQLLEAGADLVIGHHSHVWQGIDRREKTLVAYSLGNFVFTTRPEYPQQQQTGILLVTLSKRNIEEVRVVPAQVFWGQTVLLKGTPAEEVLTRVDRLSARFGTYVTPEGLVEREPFLDTRSHWACPVLRQAAKCQLVQGCQDGTFCPQDPTTYAHLVTMLVRALKLPVSPASSGSHWAAPYLQAAVEAGLWPADQVSTFPADEPVPRWQAACLLDRTFSLDAPAPAVPLYIDLDAAPSSSLISILRVSQAGIMQGYPGGRFQPLANMTRAEAVVTVLRLLQKREATAPATP